MSTLCLVALAALAAANSAQDWQNEQVFGIGREAPHAEYTLPPEGRYRLQVVLEPAR